MIGGDFMISYADIEAALNIKTAISPLMRGCIEQWETLFSGNSENREQKDGLHLAAAICTEFARLIFAESKIEISGNSKTANYLQSMIDNHLPALKTGFSAGLASGGMVIKPYFANGGVSLEWVPVQRVFPIAFTSDQSMQSAVFADTFRSGSDWYTRLECHGYDSDKKQCIIQNYTYHAYDADTLGSPCELPETPWAGLEPLVNVQSETPLFGFFRVPKPNSKDSTSALGVSVFADALPQIVQADKLWSEILWEYESKETAVFATQDIFNRFDRLSAHDKRLYKKMLSIGDDDSDKIMPYSPEIRDASFFNGLNKILQRIEFSCQLAYGTLSEPAEVAKTATEIESSKQRSYVFVSALQKQTEFALLRAITAAATLAFYHGVIPSAEFEVAFDWGDSVLEDVNAKTQRELQFVQAGILKPEIFLSSYYGCSEDEAKKMIPEAGSPEDYSLFGVGGR